MTTTYDRGPVVVVGASAGGVETLCRLVKALPADFRPPVLVVLHVSAHGYSALPQILARAGVLPAAHVRDGERLEAGRIYVAPPDQHLIVFDGRLGLTSGPKENGVRPAIDTLFRSAVHALGRRTIAVVLSGTLDDGTEGLRVVKERGGVTIAQDPDDAMFRSMPQNAIHYAHPDHVVSLDALPHLLVKLATELAEKSSPHREESMNESEEFEPADASADAQEGQITELTCPECGGTLWETGDEYTRYHCRVGHAFSPESLVALQSAALEEAMWAAVVALEERADLAERMAQRASSGHRHSLAARYARQANETRQRADVVREAIPGDEGIPEEVTTVETAVES